MAEYLTKYVFFLDPELKEWIFNCFEQGFGYKFKKFGSQAFGCLTKPYHLLMHYLIPVVRNVVIIFSVYFELFKDLVFFMTLKYFSEKVLVNEKDKFGTVGGINLTVVQWYIVAVASLSQVSLKILYLNLEG